MEVLMTDSICEDSSKLSVRGLVKRSPQPMPDRKSVV